MEEVINEWRIFMYKKEAYELLDFIHHSPSAFHAASQVTSMLDMAGFKELKEGERWSLEKAAGYYIVRNQSAVIAFRTGTVAPQDAGFKLIGAHTDSPTFRIKPNAEMVAEGCYLKLNTEVYGGPILNT
jgi:aspartyl aminopeptidase